MNKSLEEDDGKDQRKDELKQDAVMTGIDKTSENNGLKIGCWDQVRDEFSSYRSPLEISSKITRFIESASRSDGKFDINHCKKLFDPIRAVLNFVTQYKFRLNKDNAETSVDDALVAFEMKLYQVIDEKVIKSMV